MLEEYKRSVPNIRTANFDLLPRRGHEPTACMHTETSGPCSSQMSHRQLTGETANQSYFASTGADVSSHPINSQGCVET